MTDYYKQLSKEAKRRYDDKLLQLGIPSAEKCDPYFDTVDWVDDTTQWPDLQFGQIYVYLIDTPGPYTRENLRCYKSLEAYNPFFNGWVQTCYYQKINNGCIIKSKVMRSQATTEAPHEAWVAIDKDSTIVCAHCTCMAGLGEVCSHVAAILFKVEACARLGFNKVSCTSIPCGWNQNHTKKVEAARLRDISFSKPKRKNNDVHDPAAPFPNYQPVAFANTDNFLQKIKLCQPKAVIFSITDQKPQPLLSGPSLPPHLGKLYSIDNVLLTQEHLNSKCIEVFDGLACSTDQAQTVEVLTRRQSKCSLWFEYRKGRLTASNFHDIIHTNSNTISSVSLVKKILQYTPVARSTAIKWGISHESDAIQEYLTVMNKNHTNFVYRKSELVINTEFPYIGASPDGCISCDCCSEGIVEVKCPYSFSNFNPCEIKDKSFYLKSHSNNEICQSVLKQNEQYYAQVQGQIALTKTSFCDFVCWTPLGIHIERIEADVDFFTNMEIKLKSYFKNIILPELLTQKIRTEIESKDKNHSLCICGRGEDYDDMIACDNEKCSKEWFHISCVGLQSIPQGKWICLTCRNSGRGKRKRSQ